MSDFRVEEYSTDVLILGGGVAGLAAAIRARERGAKVVVLEKSHAERSGNAGSGIDHIQGYVPEFHRQIGYSEEDMIEDQYGWGGNPGRLNRRDLIEIFVRHSGHDVIELERYGLKFRFADSKLPGGFRVVPQWHYVPTSYNFEGRDLKRALNDRALELGAVILNRRHVRELIKDGPAVTGAVALGTRDRVVTVVRAKTTVVATSGITSRITAGVTGSDTFERFAAPSASVGSGKVLAAKAGAAVVNLEFSALGSSYGLVNYSFSAGLPGGTWWPAGRVVDENGVVVAERRYDLPLDDPDYRANYRRDIEKSGAQRKKIVELLQQGQVLYFDLAEATTEELDYIWWSLGHEGKSGVTKHYLAKRQVDLRKVKFPLRLGARRDVIASGVWVKRGTTETEVDNLYATGNELPALGYSGGGTALVLGYATGVEVAERAQTIPAPTSDAAPWVEALLGQVERITATRAGQTWQSGEHALTTLLDSYLGKPYSEKNLTQLAALLARLRADLTLGAGNLHELNRALEVLDLYDLAELVVAAARARKSSLGLFQRLDEKESAPEQEGVSVGVYWQDGRVKAIRLDNLFREERGDGYFH
ncbi:MAG: FAD-dependent oxidoreductase [Gracilibacteraceae bacterium]|nr:FAD-dependent oxidoreductase [Gracilibacteraceae bacterium]